MWQSQLVLVVSWIQLIPLSPFANHQLLSPVNDCCKVRSTLNRYHAQTAADRLSGDRWITAVRLLREMQATEVQVDAISYNSAISACQWPMALALLAEMKEAKRDRKNAGHKSF